MGMSDCLLHNSNWFLTLPTPTLNTEAVCSPKMSVSGYKTTWHHNLENLRTWNSTSDLHNHRRNRDHKKINQGSWIYYRITWRDFGSNWSQVEAEVCNVLIHDGRPSPSCTCVWLSPSSAEYASSSSSSSCCILSNFPTKSVPGIKYEIYFEQILLSNFFYLQTQTQESLAEKQAD